MATYDRIKKIKIGNNTFQLFMPSVKIDNVNIANFDYYDLSFNNNFTLSSTAGLTGDDDEYSTGTTTIGLKLGYTTSGNNRAVQADSNGNLYVTQKDDNTTYTNLKLGQGYGTCSTASSTYAKVVTCSSFQLSTGGIIAVLFSNAASYITTLNVNSTGAKYVRYKNTTATSSAPINPSIAANYVAYFMYNGTNYILLNWQHATASSSRNGYMSAEQAEKLDGIGSTDTSSKIYLIGATSQTADPSTYSHDTAYVDTDGCLYSNDMTTQEVDDFISSLQAASNGPVIDYIVEEDTDGNFQYRKWSGGSYEAWANFTASNLTLTTVSNNTYYGGTPTYLTLPSFSIAVDCVTYGVNSPTSSGVYVYRAYANEAATQISVEFRAHASISGATCGASVYVRGRWK